MKFERNNGTRIPREVLKNVGELRAVSLGGESWQIFSTYRVLWWQKGKK